MKVHPAEEEAEGTGLRTLTRTSVPTSVTTETPADSRTSKPPRRLRTEVHLCLRFRGPTLSPGDWDRGDDKRHTGARPVRRRDSESERSIGEAYLV